MNKIVQANVRLTPEEASKIDFLIESGDFDNRTEFIRFALKKVLMSYKPGNRLGFSLEESESMGDDDFTKKPAGGRQS